MIEQILVCEGHIYESVVYKCENRVSSENGFESKNTCIEHLSNGTQSVSRRISTKSRI